MEKAETIPRDTAAAATVSERSEASEQSEERERDLRAGLSDALDRAVSAAGFYGTRPYRLLVCDEQETRATLRRFLWRPDPWVAEADAYIVVGTVSHLGARLEDGRDFALFDTGRAVERLRQALVERGFRISPIAAFRAPELHEAFGMPRELRLIAMLAVSLGAAHGGDVGSVGCEEQWCAEGDRPNMDSLVRWNGWS